MTSRNSAENQGITACRPPNSAICARVAPLVEHADQEEQRAGRDAVVQHLVDRARHARWCVKAAMPSITKPRCDTDE